MSTMEVADAPNVIDSDATSMSNYSRRSSKLRQENNAKFIAKNENLMKKEKKDNVDYETIRKYIREKNLNDLFKDTWVQ